MDCVKMDFGAQMTKIFYSFLACQLAANTPLARVPEVQYRQNHNEDVLLGATIPSAIKEVVYNTCQ